MNVGNNSSNMEIVCQVTSDLQTATFVVPETMEMLDALRQLAASISIFSGRPNKEMGQKTLSGAHIASEASSVDGPRYSPTFVFNNSLANANAPCIISCIQYVTENDKNTPQK